MGTDLLFSVDAVVARLCSEYDADEADLAARAAHIFRDRYAEARVQGFVPILLEKELRDLLRRRAVTPAAV
jgi:hypothetical protein